MRVVFLGTPAFSVPFLKLLYFDNEIEVEKLNQAKDVDDLFRQLEED